MATDMIEAPADLEQKISPHVAWATALTITTPEAYTDAADRLKAIKALAKEIEDHHAPMKRSAMETHRRICSQEKALLDPLRQAESGAKAKMLDYQREEHRKAETERQRLQAEADAKARRERETLEKKAAAAKKPETQQRYAEQAAQVTAPVVQVQSAAQKVAGIVTKKTWKATITDRAALMAFICENKRHDLIIINEKVIEAYAKAMGSEAQMPGVRFHQQESMAAKGS